MKLAQFQVQFGDGHWFDDVIYHAQKRLKDPDPFSIHTELLFDDGRMFSSSGRGGLFAGHKLWPGMGTRFIDYCSIEPVKWKFYDLIISEDDERLIRGDCEAMKPKAYDWVGILGHGLPDRWNVQLSWMEYCSEVVNDLVCRRQADILNKRKIRPGEIVDWYRGQGLIKQAA